MRTYISEIPSSAKSAADVIETVFELLSGDGGAVGPEAFAGDHLADGVVLVNPVGGVGVRNAGALVGGVVEEERAELEFGAPEAIDVRRLRASYCLVLVMRGWPDWVKAIWLTSGELAT